MNVSELIMVGEVQMLPQQDELIGFIQANFTFCLRIIFIIFAFIIQVAQIIRCV